MAEHSKQAMAAMDDIIDKINHYNKKMGDRIIGGSYRLQIIKEGAATIDIKFAKLRRELKLRRDMEKFEINLRQSN